ncbi:MAG: nucleoside triphosphate pyrophosphatase, partial [Pyrinomonadaceae bacterium]
SVGWEFIKDVSETDETRLKGEAPDEYVVRLARAKAETVAARNKGEIVLGADTVVVIDGDILGKPVDENDARWMLKRLSGNWHEVITGVAVAGAAPASGLQRTRVKFFQMTDEEIKYLVCEGDPLDKAGAYAVQAQAALFIERVEGDYWNVVGLPISLVYRLVLKERKFIGRKLERPEDRPSDSNQLKAKS